jgi:hypothetical protein
MCQEARAVLPHALADVLALARPRSLKIARRLTRGDIIRRIDAGEVPPDHFMRQVATKVFGTMVPRQDATTRIKQ